MKSLACLLAIGILSATLGTIGDQLTTGRALVGCARSASNEKHLRNIKQLTFGGENAEAYFSADGRKLIFQSTRDRRECDQIYTMNVDGSDVQMISTGTGRTTCSYFFPNLGRVLYSSTHLGGTALPAAPGLFQGLCVGHLSHLRHFRCSPKWLADPTIDQHVPATTPRRRSRRTARR